MGIKDLDQLTDKERTALKEQINYSIHEFRKYRKRRRQFFYVAASVVGILLVGAGVHLRNNYMGTSGITKYVSSQKNVDVKESQEVQLIIGEDLVIDLSDNDSVIKHSEAGNKIAVDNKIVFQEQKKNSLENMIKFNELIVPYGKRSFMTLSDGTNVWLNSGSRLTYPLKFSENKREVYLEGEAIFEVTHNKERPFFVHTQNSEIKVLGTEFNVSNYPDETYNSTALQTGSIEITYKNSNFLGLEKTRKLKPGMISTYNKQDKEILVTKENVYKYMSWRNGILIFKNEKLDEVLKRIARYYNVNVKIQNKQQLNKTFSGSLDIKESIDAVMKVIQEATQLDYQIENQALIIN